MAPGGVGWRLLDVVVRQTPPPLFGWEFRVPEPGFARVDEAVGRSVCTIRTSARALGSSVFLATPAAPKDRACHGFRQRTVGSHVIALRIYGIIYGTGRVGPIPQHLESAMSHAVTTMQNHRR